MKLLLSGVLVALLAGNLFAQKAPIKYGDIPLEDLKMTQYDKDTSAAAVVLADYGVAKIEYNDHLGFVLLFEKIIRIKILRKSGLDHASFSIPLYRDNQYQEKLLSLKGVTYNLDNNKVVETKMKSENIFKEKVSETVNRMKFTMPGVHEGSVIDVTYTTQSDYLVAFQDWEFQTTIPVRWSEYRANIPEYFEYERFMQGYVGLTINETDQSTGSIRSVEFSRGSTSQASTNQTDYRLNKYRWVAQNVPAFRAEPYMTTHKDFISKISFELSYVKFPNKPLKPVLGSWQDINTQFNDSENFGRQVTGNNYLKSTVDEITKGMTTDEQKIAAISSYVKQNVEWNGESYKFPENSFKKVLESKKGSSAEINLLMASMLEKAKLKVYPVLISTRDHGFVRQSSPVQSQFNYVLCLVKYGDKSILLDGTDPYLPTGTLPERCLNSTGFVVSGEGFSWVPLKSAKSRRVYNADLVLSADGELSGKLSLDNSGYYAQKGRKSYLSKGEDNYIKEFVGEHTWKVSKSEFVNAKNIGEVFKEIHEVQIKDHVMATDPMLYINPFLSMNFSENPFKSEKREYPVDYGSPTEMIYMFKVKLPEGYEIEGMPKSKLITLPENAAKYSYSTMQNNGQIIITSHLQINNSLFAQDEYPHLREFYNQMIALQAEQIVLKKKL